MKIKFPLFRENKRDNDELTPEEIKAIKKLRSEICVVEEISEEKILQELLVCAYSLKRLIHNSLRDIGYQPFWHIKPQRVSKKLRGEQLGETKRIRDEFCALDIMDEDIPIVVYKSYSVLNYYYGE